MLSEYLKLAVGSLRKRFTRTLLTMIGIFIGIAAVVALVSLGQGLQAAINDQFASVGTDKVFIQGASVGFGPPGFDAAGKVDEDDLNLIQGIPGVGRAAGRIIDSLEMQYGKELDVVTMSSFPNQPDERDLVKEALSLKVEVGRDLRSQDNKKALVGWEYWGSKKYDNPMKVGSKFKLQGETFEVVGLMEKSTRLNGLIMINEDDHRDITGNKEGLSMIVAETSKGIKASDLAEKLKRTIRKDRNQKEGFEDFTVQTSEELISSVNVILGVMQGIFIGIAAISLLVGGIGIMNTMYTAVLERTREIGIMKAVGAKNADVLSIFLLESGILGLVGGSIGVLIGVGLSKIVEIGGREALGDLLQASFPPVLIIGALLFSIVIGTLSGLLPALQASKMQPVDALRKE